MVALWRVVLTRFRRSLTASLPLYAYGGFFFIYFFKPYNAGRVRWSKSVFIFISHFKIKSDRSQRWADLCAPCAQKILICFKRFYYSPAYCSALIFGQYKNGNQIALGLAPPIACYSAAPDDFLNVKCYIEMWFGRSWRDNLRRVAFYVFCDKFGWIVTAVADCERCGFFSYHQAVFYAFHSVWKNDFLSALYPLRKMWIASSSNEARKASPHTAQLYISPHEIKSIYGRIKTAAPVSLFR